MRRSALPKRANPLKRGAFNGRNPSRSGTRATIGRYNDPTGKPASPRKAPRDTGFTYAQRMKVRARAGNDNIEDACCECCGRWLGRYGGQVHHRCNRQAGGSRLRNRLSNAVLACGTPLTLCHGKCTALDEQMRAEGFVLDSGQDPLAEPIMLHGEQGGVTVWLDDDGKYLRERPEVAA